MYGCDPCKRRTRASRRALWRDADLAERRLLLTAGLMLVVAVALSVVNPAALPVSGAVVVGALVALARVRARTRRRHQAEQEVAAEAARGIAELERWLASRRWA